jgi:hypothetical protein
MSFRKASVSGSAEVGPADWSRADWRRQARAGICAAHLVTDNRSEDRAAF